MPTGLLILNGKTKNSNKTRDGKHYGIPEYVYGSGQSNVWVLIRLFVCTTLDDCKPKIKIINKNSLKKRYLCLKFNMSNKNLILLRYKINCRSSHFTIQKFLKVYLNLIFYQMGSEKININYYMYYYFSRYPGFLHHSKIGCLNVSERFFFVVLKAN